MQSRRSRARPAPRAASDLALLEVGPDSTRPVRLVGGRPLVVSSREGWEVRVVVVDQTVEVRASGGAAVRVNDVQVRGIARARAGDLIALPDRSLLVQQISPVPAAPVALASHETFEQRLIEEVSRAAPARAAVSVLVVRSRALLSDGLGEFLTAPEFQVLRQRERSVLVGQVAPGTLELLCPGASTVDADAVREHLSEALGRLGRPFRWGWATSPMDALHASTLWGRALDRLFAETAEAAEDLPHTDPVMVRLWSLCDVWAGLKGGVVLQGEVGSGRETLGRVIHERRSSQGPFVVVRSAAFDSGVWRASVDRARGGTLYVRHPAGLPAAELASFWDATAFRPMAGSEGDGGRPDVPVIVAVPALRDRPLDVLPIAEHVLARCTGFDGPRKLKLTPSARTVLLKHWIGSVRELKSSLQRAALLVDASGEVLPEHLTTSIVRFPGGGPRETDLRAALKTMERRTLLETLGRTGWNVTEAARLLGLPRRTVVYRMSRLGLRRPASSG